MNIIDIDRHSQIVDYLALMLEANKKVNLTRIIDIEQAKLLHIEDSLTALEYFQEEDIDDTAKQIMDLGAGCGFPGVALSIATGIPAVLVDSVAKKMNAVDQILRQCGLSDSIRTVSSRIEELAGEAYLSEYVVSRAMASLPAVMELATPLLKHDGTLIIYKGDIDGLERTSGLQIQDLLGLSLIDEKRIALGSGDIHRTLFVFRKTSEPEMKLPRRIGKAQKQPLSI